MWRVRLTLPIVREFVIGRAGTRAAPRAWPALSRTSQIGGLIRARGSEPR
jgi:hypothetical protein